MGWWEGPQSGPVDLIDGAEGVLHLLEANAGGRKPKWESRLVERTMNGDRFVIKRLVHDDRHGEPTRYHEVTVTLLSDPACSPHPTHHFHASGVGLQTSDGFTG